MKKTDLVVERGISSARIKEAFAYDQDDNIVKAAEELYNCFFRGGRAFIIGNGGSAADAQHFAAELVGRFQRERDPFPAIALTTDTSAITAIGNDYGYENVFDRQVSAFVGHGDVLVAVTTSGKSENILKAVATAKRRAVKVISLTGLSETPLENISDVHISVPSTITARIQECHIWALHTIAELIEDWRTFES